MKKVYFVLLMVVLASAMIFSGCSSPDTTNPPETKAPSDTTASTKVIELRMSTTSPEMMKDLNNVSYFCSYLEENSDGRIKIKRYYGGSLASELEMLDLIKVGGADIVGFSPYNLYQDSMPFVGGVQFLYPRDYPDILSFLNGIVFENPNTAPICEKELVQQNIEFMTYCSTGEMVICVNFLPAASLADLQGKKIASLSDLPYFDAVGMSTVMSSIDEAYESLGRNVYQGFTFSTSLMANLKLQEVSKAAVRLGVAGCSDAIAINKDTWNHLPADLQQVCRDAADFSRENSLKIFGESEKRAIQIFLDAGCEVNLLSSEDQMTLALAMLDEWEKTFTDLCKRSGVSDANRDMLIKYVSDFTHSK